MDKNICVAKSFYCLGNNLKGCYKCSYCRIQNEIGSNVPYETLPTQINKSFVNIPIAINLFYGDPLLQIDNTINILRRLEKERHKGAVVIITKGDFNKFPDIKFDLDLHFGFSTFGMNHEYDGGTWEQFISNVKSIETRVNKYKYSIEFRPICYGINDNYETLERVILIGKEFNLPISYSGLQGKPEIINYWKDNNINLIPYPNFEFGHLKPISNEVENNIRSIALKHEVKLFHKSSCLISYVHNYERDYNCHYYRPDEVKCDLCPMNEKCASFKNNIDVSKIEIPFNYVVEHKTKHECVLKQ